MRISNKEFNNRKSKIKALFFVKHKKQKEIAKKMGIAVKTVEKYVAKIKQES